MTTGDPRTVSLDWIKIENVIAKFESERQLGPVLIEDFLPPREDPYYIPLLRELVRVDLELSWEDGTPRSLDSYCNDFPILLDSPVSLTSIAFEEFRLRRASNSSLTREEYAKKYHVHVSAWPSVDPDPPRTNVLHNLSVLNADGSRVPDPSEFPEVGENFLGFRIRLELGCGAFARVYLAEQRELACRQVVLKVSTQFKEESQTLARLQHTNIIPIYSSHCVGRFQAICMPYFGSTTLQDLLNRFKASGSVHYSGNEVVGTIRLRQAAITVEAGELDPVASMSNQPPRITPEPLLDHLTGLSRGEVACWIVAELAEGLAYAHGRGIYHCDLKPANVLISHEGRPMLLDFNLAASGQTDGLGTRGGTPYYMAPEQLRGLCGESVAVDARSDIYALGLMLYELLCGRLPDAMPKGKFEEQLRQLLQSRSTNQSLGAISNPSIRAILRKCLDHDPNHRYVTANQLQEDLRHHLSHRPTQWAKEPFGLNRTRKWLRRNSWVTSSLCITTAAVVGVTLSVLAGVQVARERSRTEADRTARSLRSDLDYLRPRLITPDPDPLELRSVVERAESILARWDLIERDEEFCEKVLTFLNERDSQQTRALITDSMLQTAQGRFLLGDSTLGLKWNERAEAFAKGQQPLWLARWQRIGFLRYLGRNEEATSLQDSLGRPPEEATFRLFQAQTLFSRGDYRSALKELQTRDLQLLQRADYWHMKASSHAQLGAWGEAIASYTTAMTHQPLENDHLYASRARAYLAVKDFAAAKTDLDTAITARPGHPRYLVDRAIARLGAEDFSGAIEDLNEAEKLWPEHTRILFLRAQVRLKANDPVGAGKDRQAGLTRKPGDEISWIARGVARLRSETKGAIEDFDAALELNPASAQAMQNKAHVLSEKLNQPDEAIRVLDELIKQHPSDPYALAGRGVLLARLGKRDLAHRDATRVLSDDLAPMLRYQAAGIFALTSRTHPEDRHEAIRLLSRAFREGVTSSIVDSDSDLDPIRSEASFQSLLQAVKLIERSQGKWK
jgi:eukaryotic-like serine/threonine-protein kinase